MKLTVEDLKQFSAGKLSAIETKITEILDAKKAIFVETQKPNIMMSEQKKQNKKTFAQWEKQVRMIDDTIPIKTEVDKSGQVIKAWTKNDSWSLHERANCKIKEDSAEDDEDDQDDVDKNDNDVEDDEEELDELSKDTLKRYVNKATGQLVGHGMDVQKHSAKFNKDELLKAGKKVANKRKGINLAADKLAR